MSWYKQGTVAVTNASAAVVGTGTAWVANAKAGDIFVAPDGKPYEVQSVNSDTSITLASNYPGSTASGQAYSIAPTQDYIRTLADQVGTLIASYQAVVNAAGAGKFGDGNAASPGVTFVSDLDTGLFRPATNTIGFSTNGSEKARLTSAGEMIVGTNTTSSLGVLQTYSASGVAGDFTGSGNTRIRVRSRDAASGAAVMLQNASAGTGNTDGFELSLQTDNVTVGLWNYENGSMFFGTNNAERVRIDASGHTYPGGDATQTLGTSARRWSNVFASAITDGADQLLGSSGSTVKLGFGAAWTALSLGTAAAERVHIDSTGVGIGGTAATKLHVFVGAAARAFTLQGSSSTWSLGPSGANFTLRENSSGADFVTIDSSGRVGVAMTPDPAYYLDVAGAARLGNGQSLTWGSTYASGGPTIAGSTNFIAMYPSGATSGEKWRLGSTGEVLMKNTGVAPGTPSGGGYLYVDAGALKYKGSSGTVTTIAAA